ncbi:PLC-like phosphodiesterase [Calocera cornea HHB12733]|uniref:PLC-like phosphodiesterase n=1 Tax=Calocera cornea HHB12733 TaxID=1353952 RepID=A0A165E133_9BASI|nr:PLC-like phosphodiesterase [Calocera cornea HHB12733]
MPSKGIDAYCYVGLPGAHVDFTVAGKNVIRRDCGNNFTASRLDMDWSNADWHGCGLYSWTVFGTDGKALTSREVTVNTLTGRMYGTSSLAPFNTPAIIQKDYCICYGYYVAGKGVLGLTNRHQSWVTVTPRRSNWMGELVPPGSCVETKSFSLFVLPGAHNAGMNTMDNFPAFMHMQTKPPVMTPTQARIAALSMRLCRRGIHNMAITQKESITAMLHIGTRMFDFRPAFLSGVSPSNARSIENVYATHVRIPGIDLATFLKELIDFLKDNPTEIVVLSLSSAGIRGCEQPKREALRRAVNRAFPESLRVGWGHALLSESVAELRASRIRVIVPDGATGYDAWSGKNHRAFTPDKIINNVFRSLNAERHAAVHITKLRCALTPTATGKGIVAHSAISDKSSSPLMEVKARSDLKTLKWIRDHALEHLKADTTITVTNDFIDGQTVEICVTLSDRRFGIPDPVP